MAEFYSSVYTHTHPPLSVYGYLACFHILSTINNAAVIIGMHILFELSVSYSLDKYPEVEKLDHMAVLLIY